MNKKFYLKSLIVSISEEKCIDINIIFNILEYAFLNALKKKFKPLNIEIFFDKVNYSYYASSIYFYRKYHGNIALKYPFKFFFQKFFNFKLTNIFKKKLVVSSFKRKEIFEAKDIVINKLRIAERKNFIDEFEFFLDKTVSGMVKKIFSNYILINIEKDIYGILNKDESILSEAIFINSILKVYIKKIVWHNNEPMLYLSRVCDELLLDLLKLEIPEVNSGLIIVKSVIRLPGVRSKVVVYTDYSFNPVTFCLGLNGIRIKNISNYLNGEFIDIILWSNNMQQYFVNMFPKFYVKYVELDYRRRVANLIVDENDISLMIGENGIHVNLLNKLTSWKIKLLNYV